MLENLAGTGAVPGSSSGIAAAGGQFDQIQFCDVCGHVRDFSGCSAGPGSFSLDPLLIEGPGGTACLPHVDTGQEQTSPCVDAGAVGAEVVYPDSDHSTRTDGVSDAGRADLGYHALVDAPTPLPEPTTPPLGVQIDMPRLARPGDPFWVAGLLHNPGDDLEDAPVAFILEVLGRFRVWPAWSEFDPRSTPLPQLPRISIDTGTTRVEVVRHFIWPDLGAETQSGLRMHGAVLTHDQAGLLGSTDMVEWGYAPSWGKESP